MRLFHKTIMGMFLFWLFAVIVNIGVLALAVWVVVKILQMMGVI